MVVKTSRSGVQLAGADKPMAGHVDTDDISGYNLLEAESVLPHTSRPALRTAERRTGLLPLTTTSAKITSRQLKLGPFV